MFQNHQSPAFELSYGDWKKRLFRLYVKIGLVFIRKADDLFVSAPEITANPPVKILNDYFDAVTRLDRETIQKICNIDIYEGPNFEYFVRRLGFTPGYLSNVDFLRVSDDLWAAYLRGMGYEGTVDEMMSAYAEDIKEDGDIIFSGFMASYKLLDLKPAEDCKVQFQSGLKKIEVPGLKEKIKEDRQLDEVDEAYIAKMKIYWEYKGFPYGNDEKLWDLSELSGIDTYETIKEKNEDMDYYAFIYRVGDDWFLYHDSIIKNSYVMSIDMG